MVMRRQTAKPPRTRKPPSASAQESAPSRGIASAPLFWSVVCVLAAILGGGALLGSKEIYSLYHLKQEKDILARANLELQDENQRLLKTIDRLQNDPEMIEDLIRRELNFVKKNELIFLLTSEGAKPPTPVRETPPAVPAKGKAGTRRQ